MNINFKTKGVELDDTITSYAQEKVATLEKLIEGAAQEDARFDVDLSKDGTQATGEIYRADIVAIAGSLDMHAVGHGESLQAALDGARDDLARRLRRDKGRKEDMFLKGKRAIKKMLHWG